MVGAQFSRRRSRYADTMSAERDDRDAIDESNIIDERTRGAKPQGTYQEPGDEEGLPSDTGRSRVAQ
jgi:hypothetical protein